MALPVPYYRYPNTYNRTANVTNLSQVAFININGGGPTASGVQNKNGGVVMFGRPGVTQSRFHLETDGNLYGKVSDRVGGFPAIFDAFTQMSGEMGVTKAVSSLAFGKVTAQQYICYMLKPNTQLVGGSAFTGLQSPGARFNGIDKAVQNKNPGYVYTAHVIMMNGGYSNLLGWNYITGRLLSDNPSGTQDTLATDVTANPSRSLPGLLVYLDAGKTIFSGYFKSKTD